MPGIFLSTLLPLMLLVQTASAEPACFSNDLVLRQIIPDERDSPKPPPFLKKAQILSTQIRARYQLPSYQAAEELIRTRFESILEKTSLPDALETLGIFSGLDKVRFIKWAKRHPNMKNTALALTLDIGPKLSVDLLSHLSGMPLPGVGYFFATPDLRFFEPTLKEISEASEVGFEALKPRVIARYQNQALGELYYNFIRKRATEGSLIFLAYYVTKNFEAVKSNLKLAHFLVSLLSHSSPNSTHDLETFEKDQTLNSLRHEFSRHEPGEIPEETLWMITRETLRICQVQNLNSPLVSGRGSLNPSLDSSTQEIGIYALSQLKSEAPKDQQKVLFEAELKYINWTRNYLIAKDTFNRALTPRMNEETIWWTAQRITHSPKLSKLLVEETFRESTERNSPRARKFKEIFLRPENQGT